MALSEDMQEFLKGLTTSLTAAVATGAGSDEDDDVTKGKKGVMPPQFKKLADDVDALTKRIDVITAALAPGDDKGEGVGAVMKLLKAMGEKLDTHGTVLESMLEKSAVRKSLRGDDFDDDDKTKKGGDDGKTPVTKAGMWDGPIRAAINGAKIELS